MAGAGVTLADSRPIGDEVGLFVDIRAFRGFTVKSTVSVSCQRATEGV